MEILCANALHNEVLPVPGGPNDYLKLFYKFSNNDRFVFI